MRSFDRYAALSILVMGSEAKGADTEFQYLSGLGKDGPIQWQILCENGAAANKWSTIGVPSNWELQCLGIYTYGRIKPESGWRRVHCTYKRSFTTPATWREKAVFVNFEGVMTDTEVTINGGSAGPVHQGGYYASKYNITSLLKPAGQAMKFRSMWTTDPVGFDYPEANVKGMKFLCQGRTPSTRIASRAVRSTSGTATITSVTNLHMK